VEPVPVLDDYPSERGGKTTTILRIGVPRPYRRQADNDLGHKSGDFLSRHFVCERLFQEHAEQSLTPGPELTQGIG